MHLANLSKEHGANLHLRLGDGKKKHGQNWPAKFNTLNVICNQFPSPPHLKKKKVNPPWNAYVWEEKHALCAATFTLVCLNFFYAEGISNYNWK